MFKLKPIARERSSFYWNLCPCSKQEQQWHILVDGFHYVHLWTLSFLSIVYDVINPCWVFWALFCDVINRRWVFCMTPRGRRLWGVYSRLTGNRHPSRTLSYQPLPVSSFPLSFCLKNIRSFRYHESCTPDLAKLSQTIKSYNHALCPGKN